MNILVIGAGGQLGSEMRVVCAGSTDHYLFTRSSDLDITDAAAVLAFVKSHKVNVIVNCAAYTAVDRAEDEIEAARRVNVLGPENLALAAREAGATLFHISTDYVFGGQGSTPYKEDDPTAPLGVYAQSKLDGEKAILASGCKHLILRTAWLYSPFGKNFLRTMLNLTATKPAIKVVDDQRGTPTYALDLAQCIFDIISSRGFVGKEGIYHYSDEGSCSWYEFACEIASLSGQTACRISPCRSEEYPTKVTRPAYSVLDKSKLKEAFGIEIPHWKDSLKACLKEMRSSL